MTTVVRGSAATLTVEWRLYSGGPFSAVTGVTITITPAAGGAPVLATTAAGVTNPTTGINVYSWTPAGFLAPGSYLVTWSGTDPDSETVGAAELVTVVAGGALGGPYATRAALKRRMSIPDANTVQDADADSALASASEAINRWCGRQFGQALEASERTYTPGPGGVDTDDFWTTDDLVIWGTAYAAGNYSLEPANGIVDGVPGWPFNRVGAPYGSFLSFSWLDSPITVSARWGWAQVPESIVSACLMLAADTLKSKDAPFGVAGFGDYVVRVRANPKVAELLAPYVRYPAKVA